ncbi:MAG: hypothetical protein EP329_04095 [Deltaproteobacteria bacterium]|nr:MAG: hypothetical protein EP329_04095 [Deltaproteobacteria bacterium]
MARAGHRGLLAAIGVVGLLGACEEVDDLSSGALEGDTAPDVVADVAAPAGWPWPAVHYDVPESTHWTDTLEVPRGSRFFTVADRRLGTFLGSFAKLTVLTGDPTRLYLQDIEAYPLHYDFAVTHLRPFVGMSRAAFDAATQYDAGKKAILGVLYLSFEPNPREIGVELVGRDPYPPAVVATVLDLVTERLVVTDGGPPPTVYYFPSVEQRDWARAHRDDFEAAGVRVSGLGRWTDGDLCYGAPWLARTEASGHRWAVGRLVHLAAAEVAAAWERGDLGPTDVLLFDEAPDSLPRVAGALVLAPTNPHGRPALQAGAYAIPFAHLADPEAALALVGHVVAVRVHDAVRRYTVGACEVELLDLEKRIAPADLAALATLAAPPALGRAPRGTAERLAASPSTLTPSDVDRFGGEAVRFGFLRATLPEQSPGGAVALSFGAWDALLDRPVARGGTLRDAIQARLGRHAWPPGPELAGDLAEVRALIRATAFSNETRHALLDALASLATSHPVALRASTNAEDGASLDAALYSPVEACVLDDQDVEDLGPSRCLPAHAEERGVFAALREVFAQAYQLDAYLGRLRRGFDEATLGVGALVRAAPIAADVSASGLVTLASGGVPLLVTQRGTGDVLDPAARPEIASPGWEYGPPLVTQWAALGPLGAPALDWTHRDYAAVAILASALGAAWAIAHPDDHLMVGYEQVVADEVIRVTRFETLAPREVAATVPTYLLPEPARDLCVGLTEVVSVSALHRAKGRLTVSNAGAWLDAKGLATPYLRALAHTFLDDGAEVTVAGRPTGLPEWEQTIAPTTGALVMRWAHGVGLSRRVFALSHRIVSRVTPSDLPLLRLEDLDLALTVTYATPRRNMPFGEETLEDVVHLIPCSAEPASEVAVETVAEGGGVTVEAEVWLEPVIPSRLTRWGRTTITGLTAAPITLEDAWARTVGVHSYNPLRLEFVFEPALDPSVPAETRAELAAAGVVQVVVAATPLGGSVLLVGPDGVARTP